MQEKTANYAVLTFVEVYSVVNSIHCIKSILRLQGGTVRLILELQQRVILWHTTEKVFVQLSIVVDDSPSLCCESVSHASH